MNSTGFRSLIFTIQLGLATLNTLSAADSIPVTNYSFLTKYQSNPPTHPVDPYGVLSFAGVNGIGSAYFDTLYGPVHSNDVIAIEINPVFINSILTTSDTFNYIGGSDRSKPVLKNSIMEIRKKEVPFPNSLRDLKIGATQSSSYFKKANVGFIVIFEFDGTRYRTGLYPEKYIDKYYPVLDSPAWRSINLFPKGASSWKSIPSNGAIYCEDKVGVFGRISGKVTLGSADTAYVVGNIYYDCVKGFFSSSGGLQKYPKLPDSNCKDAFCLISEEDILLADNRQNRTNGLVVYGSLVALGKNDDKVTNPKLSASFGSITVENLHYQMGGVWRNRGSESKRGILFVFGSMIQRRFGQVHTGQGAGYFPRRFFDIRLIDNPPPFLPKVPSPMIHAFANRPKSSIKINQWYLDQFVFNTEVTKAKFTVELTKHPDWLSYTYNLLRGKPGISDTGIAHCEAKLTSEIFGTDTIQWDIRVIGPTGLREPESKPAGFSLSAFPNPFNPVVELEGWVEPTTGTKPTLTIFNLTGESLQTWQVESGRFKYSWSGWDQPSGIYHAMLKVGNRQLRRKLVLLR